MKHANVKRRSESTLLVTLFNENEPTATESVRCLTASGVKRIATLTGLPLPEIQKIIAQLPVGQDRDVDLPQAEVNSDMTIFLRGLHQPASEATAFTGEPVAALREVLSVDVFNHPEPVIYWKDDRLAVVDVDYHGEYKPTDDTLETLASLVEPQPFVKHRSHGGGYKLFFTSMHGLTAEEWAALGALGWKTLDGRAAAEVKTDSRHPLFDRRGQSCGYVHWGTQTEDAKTVAEWLSRSTDDAKRDDWLDSRGLTLGQRVDTTFCPIEPGHSTSSLTPPVVVGDYGLYCFSCAGRGQGGRRPGFVSYNTLIGSSKSRVYKMLEKFVHWGHAKYIMKAMYTGVPEKVLRLAYRAALKLLHQPTDDDPRISLAFRDDYPLIYVDGQWRLSVTEPLRTVNAGPILAKLPGVQVPTAEGWKPSQEIIARWRNGQSLTDEAGYEALVPVIGFPIWGHRLKYPNNRASIISCSLREDVRPRYRRKGDRIPLEDAWAVIESKFDGIDRDYITLCIAAAGIAEGGVEGPKIICDGLSGSGKSLTPQVAAAIIGQRAGEVPLKADSENTRRSLWAAMASGNIVVCNEWLKSSRPNRMTASEAVDIFLNWNAGTQVHELHVGPRAVGRESTIVVTEHTIPDVVRMDDQIGRRFVHVHQPYSRNWGSKETFDVYRWREIDPHAPLAFDTIMSDIIDRWFSDSPPTWAWVVSELGYKSLRDSEAFASRTYTMKKFFDAVCDAPPADDREISRILENTEGFKAVKFDNTDDELTALWLILCDEKSQKTSRLIDAFDWHRLLGLTKNHPAVNCDYVSVGHRLWVRFRCGGSPAAPGLLNDDIRKVAYDTSRTS